MKLRCKLIAGSDVEHLHQIYAGFAMLHRAGEIDLEQVIPRDALEKRNETNRWSDYRFFNTTVVVNDSLRVTYDTHDWAWIDPEILDSSDIYFKRSYRADKLEALESSHKIHPLGLNMQVNSAARDPFRFRRARMYRGTDRLKTMLKSLRFDKLLANSEVERLDNFEREPQTDLKAGILYMARLWDPKRIESKRQSQLVEAMNESRADSVRRLRKEFGPLFFGGVSRDDYSEKYFPDVLIEDASLSQKRTYLQKLREFPICVATVGLNGSNGWKLAEYVAGSKAILSEPLVYDVPGEFRVEKNYLEFQGADQLTAAARRLLDNADLRVTLMKNNREYFKNFVRPDALVRHTLAIISGALVN